MDAPPLLSSHPLLSCAAARAHEEALFGGDEVKEWAAMQRAGAAVAAGMERDYREIGSVPVAHRILVLVGKGHNGGDALLAARTWLQRHPQARACIHYVGGERPLRPLAARASQLLRETVAARVEVWTRAQLLADRAPLAALIDGVFGFQFRPPLSADLAALFRAINLREGIALRAAVDLPSGFDDPDALRADFSYATGVAKTPLLTSPAAGRLRYLDLGFWEKSEPPGVRDRVLRPEVLAPLAGLRPSASDKRTYGHLFVVGGSRDYPGAVLLAVRAALRTGVGLLTAFVPESLVPAYAAQVPEAMWVAWPESPEGGLAWEGIHLLQARLPRATALTVGPGIGRTRETQALIGDLVRRAERPLVLDADALQPEHLEGAGGPLILTPHAGEFARLAEGEDLRSLAARVRATVVLKGPVTRLATGTREEVWHSFFGGPVLARGGSGDLLAGMIGGLLAQRPSSPLLAAARGVVWQGLAADLWARTQGAVAGQTSQLLDFLGPVLRGCEYE